MDWRERRLKGELYTEQSVKILLNRREEEKCEDWKRIQTRMLSVPDSIHLIGRVLYQ